MHNVYVYNMYIYTHTHTSYLSRSWTHSAFCIWWVFLMCSYCVPNLFAGGRTLPYAFGRGAGGHRGTGIPQTLPTKEERERETHGVHRYTKNTTYKRNYLYYDSRLWLFDRSSSSAGACLSRCALSFVTLHILMLL